MNTRPRNRQDGQPEPRSRARARGSRRRSYSSTMDVEVGASFSRRPLLADHATHTSEGHEATSGGQARGSLHMSLRQAGETVLDGLGHELQTPQSIDVVKSRFFILGMQVGLTLQVFVVSIAVMVISYDEQTGAKINEMSRSYYSLFRALLLICVFACAHGVLLFAWKRFGVGTLTRLHRGHPHVRAPSPPAPLHA